MIHIKALTYRQFENNMEDTQNFYVNDLPKNIAEILDSYFPINVTEMIEFVQEIIELNLNRVKVLQIKTPQRNLILVKKIKQLNPAQIARLL
ncbi:hypothetical protein [Flavobacterium sp. 1355]|uniref:hypothetical protein n=1 Tax=Flavobacterium sp. 1355 TaxID=2806571 RepID=UPI001AE2A034|nr:hypothetical protein [Flavobacterium sp. 1355]MBP1223148.1 hypothetical protein [Flavobacterium sp. 1355]